jgi:hypothetical protein
MTPRQNPFRAERLDALSFVFQDTSTNELLARLEILDFRAAIIGAHGNGKSTLLETLAPHLQTRGWNIHRLFLNSSQRDFSSATWRKINLLRERDFILLDGAEQLSFLQRNQFLRASRFAAGVLLTAHHAGIFPTLYECRSSIRLLKTLVFQLAPDGNENKNFVEELFARHNGNLRDALREMYDFRAREK